MSKFKRTASFVALLTCLSGGQISPVFAAQMDFQESLEEQPSSLPLPAANLDSEFCEEPPIPQPGLNSEEESQQKLTLGPNLVASAVASDIPLGVEGKRTVVAQAPVICDLGGVAPSVGGVGGGFNPLFLTPIIPGAVCIAICGDGDDDPDPPPVPEPSDFATAGLFASLGAAGLLYRRRLKQGQSL